MPTIADVAKRAGVSTYTVSAVLNRSARVSPELTRRVLEAVRDLDYTINSVARSLQTRKTQTIGMVLPNVANPFFGQVAAGVESVCRAKGYTLLLGTTGDDAAEQTRCIANFRSKQVDGLIVFMAAGSEPALAGVLEKGPPLVLAGRRPASIKADTVTADNHLGARLAVDHLIWKGHSRIALITGPAMLSISRDRVDGWREGLETAALTADPELARETDWTEEAGYRQTLALLSLERRPTAIYSSSLLLMAGSLRAIKDAGLNCPRDVEVVSADDSEWLDIFEPRISSVLQPSFEMGVAAAELLFRRIHQPRSEAEMVVLKPSLKPR